MYKLLCLFLVTIFATSCGISEDCFKGNGNLVTLNYPLDGFTKIKVHQGVGLVVKEGPNYEVIVKTNDKISNDIDVQLQDDMLVVKDNSTCNIAREYGQTVVYVTIPDGAYFPLIQELELHSKTEQTIRSEGVLNSPIVRLFSIDLSDGAGTGDFYINVENSQLVVESNNVANFYINGQCNNLLLNFYFGNGKFKGENLEVQNCTFLHRGANDIFVKPIQKIEGVIYATGNVILQHIPPVINVEEKFSGRLIY